MPAPHRATSGVSPSSSSTPAGCAARTDRRVTYPSWVVTERTHVPGRKATMRGLQSSHFPRPPCSVPGLPGKVTAQRGCPVAWQQYWQQPQEHSTDAQPRSSGGKPTRTAGPPGPRTGSGAAELRMTRGTIPSCACASCTDRTGNRIDGTHGAGITQRPCPRTSPRPRPCVPASRYCT